MNQNARRGGIAAIAAGGLVVVALIGPMALGRSLAGPGTGCGAC